MTKKEILALAERFTKGIQDQTLGAQFETFDFETLFSTDIYTEHTRNGKYGELRWRTLNEDYSMDFDAIFEEKDWLKACMAVGQKLYGQQFAKFVGHLTAAGDIYFAWSYEKAYEMFRLCASHAASAQPSESGAIPQLTNAVLQFRVALWDVINQLLIDNNVEYEMLDRYADLAYESKYVTPGPNTFKPSGIKTSDLFTEEEIDKMKNFM